MLWQHRFSWITLLLVMVIGSSLLQARPAFGTAQASSPLMPPGIDIAIGQPPSASSETASQPAANAVDGDATTHWCPGAGMATAQLTLELDDLRELNGTGVTWVGRAPEQYAVQISVDGQHWYEFPGTRSSANALTTVDLVAGRAAPARFVRLSFSDSAALPCVAEFWAYPGHQDTPAAWQGQDLTTLANTVYDYTRSVVSTLTQQGTPPDIVQIGNEVTAA